MPKISTFLGSIFSLPLVIHSLWKMLRKTFIIMRISEIQKLFVLKSNILCSRGAMGFIFGENKIENDSPKKIAAIV